MESNIVLIQDGHTTLWEDDGNSNIKFYSKYRQCKVENGIVSLNNRHGFELDFWSRYNTQDIFPELKFAPRQLSHYVDGKKLGLQFEFHEISHRRQDKGGNLKQVNSWNKDGQCESFITLNESQNLASCWYTDGGTEYFNGQGYTDRTFFSLDNDQHVRIQRSTGRPTCVDHINDKNLTMERVVYMPGSFRLETINMMDSAPQTLSNVDITRNRRNADRLTCGLRINYNHDYQVYEIQFLKDSEDITDEVVTQVMDPLAVTEAEEAMLSIHYGDKFRACARYDVAKQELIKLKEKGNYRIGKVNPVSK